MQGLGCQGAPSPLCPPLPFDLCCLSLQSHRGRAAQLWGAHPHLTLFPYPYPYPLRFAPWPCSPTEDELHNFGVPDFTIYNGGAFPANRYTSYMTSSTSIDVSLKHKEMVSGAEIVVEGGGG